MTLNCPSCQEQLQFSEAQSEKIKSALNALAAGKTLRLGCPHCHEAIELQADGSVSAKSEFQEPKREEPSQGRERKLPEPPGPPDIDWLVSDVFSDDDVLEDVPTVLILMPHDENRESVVKVFREIGYQTVSAESAHDAMEKMRFVNYHAVIYHTEFEKGGLAESDFHNSMRSMAMNRRRQVFYVLIGPDFHTLYDLEALALSANVVINDKDVNKIPLVFRKSMHDFEELMGPYLAIMKQTGKK